MLRVAALACGRTPRRGRMVHVRVGGRGTRAVLDQEGVAEPSRPPPRKGARQRRRRLGCERRPVGGMGPGLTRAEEARADLARRRTGHEHRREGRAVGDPTGCHEQEFPLDADQP